MGQSYINMYIFSDAKSLCLIYDSEYCIFLFDIYVYLNIYTYNKYHGKQLRIAGETQMKYETCKMPPE